MWRIRKEIIYSVSFSRFLSVIKFNNESYDTQGDVTWSDSYIASRKRQEKLLWLTKLFLSYFTPLSFHPETQHRQHTILCFFIEKIWYSFDEFQFGFHRTSNTALNISFKIHAGCVSVWNKWSLFLRWFGSGWWENLNFYLHWKISFLEFKYIWHYKLVQLTVEYEHMSAVALLIFLSISIIDVLLFSLKDILPELD